MRKNPIVVAICENCVDYVDEGAALYRHGDDYRHLTNNRSRCPGQEDDGTDDRAEPVSLEEFHKFHKGRDSDWAAEILTHILECIAEENGQKPLAPTGRYAGPR